MPRVPKKSPRRPWMAAPKQQTGRKKSNQKFYNSQKWRRNRAQFLKENPLCVECQKIGEIVPATVADHIVTINDGGAKLDWNNLQGLCDSHHNQKSGRESAQAKKKQKDDGKNK